MDRGRLDGAGAGAESVQPGDGRRYGYGSGGRWVGDAGPGAGAGPGPGPGAGAGAGVRWYGLDAPALRWLSFQHARRDDGCIAWMVWAVAPNARNAVRHRYALCRAGAGAGVRWYGLDAPALRWLSFQHARRDDGCIAWMVWAVAPNARNAVRHRYALCRGGVTRHDGAVQCAATVDLTRRRYCL